MTTESTATRFRVRSLADFAAVESHVSILFSSPSSGASLLRSASFLRFRMRCLYRACKAVPPWYAPDGRLLVSLERAAPGEPGGWVTVATREDARSYDDSWDARDEPGTGAEDEPGTGAEDEPGTGAGDEQEGEEGVGEPDAQVQGEEAK